MTFQKSTFFYYNRPVEKIQFFCIEECPSTEQAWNDLLDCLNKLGITIQPERIVIHDDLEAEFHTFQGSPSIKVDGVDLWKREQAEFHMGYRSYTTPGGLSDRPTIEMLTDQLNLHL
ncbi:MAG TPA: hypothetical protein DIW44_01845 [Anaerolineaceae bacterium]|nr:hypothetical protein [Anaerolineaceae bacterium]